MKKEEVFKILTTEYQSTAQIAKQTNKHWFLIKANLILLYEAGLVEKLTLSKGVWWRKNTKIIDKGDVPIKNALKESPGELSEKETKEINVLGEI